MQKGMQYVQTMYPVDLTHAKAMAGREAGLWASNPMLVH